MASQDEPLNPDGIIQSGGLPDDGALSGFGAPGAGGDDPLSALLGNDGGLDLGALMEQATDMQARMVAAQERAAATEVEGVAGGGAVRITVTGGGEFRSVHIEPSAVDPNDVDMLQDLVLAALRDANERIGELQASSMGDLGGLGGLGDLFG